MSALRDLIIPYLAPQVADTVRTLSGALRGAPELHTALALVALMDDMPPAAGARMAEVMIAAATHPGTADAAVARVVASWLAPRALA